MPVATGAGFGSSLLLGTTSAINSYYWREHIVRLLDLSLLARGSSKYQSLAAFARPSNYGLLKTHRPSYFKCLSQEF